MSDTKTTKQKTTKQMIRNIARLLRTLNEELEEYIEAAVQLGDKISRRDILGRQKVMDAVHLEVIRGLPAARLVPYGSVKNSTRKLPG